MPSPKTSAPTIPILVTCKDRLRYLDVTLKSLAASVPSDTPVYVSDDGSESSEMRRYLTTNEMVKVNDNLFPNEHPDWIKFVGPLPNHARIRGVAGKVSVFLREQPCGIKNFTFAVARIFRRHQCSHVIKVQDDVVFKEGWYSTLCDILLQTNASLVSGFRYFISKTYSLRTVRPDAQELVEGNVGAVLMAISRKACEKNRVLLFNNNLDRKDMDHFWIDNCREAGMPILVTDPSLCQHIGFRSLIYRGNFKEYMFSESKRRVDEELAPPYALASEVKKMGMADSVVNADKVF